MELRWYQKEAVEKFFEAARKFPNDDLVEVLPTGAGKSVILGSIVGRVAQWGTQGRSIILARSRELVVQNHAAFCRLHPELQDRTGVYCAGLGLKEYDRDIVFASIQSVSKKGDLFSPRKLVVIDEAHQVPRGSETQYQTFLADVRKTDPSCKLLGLTASPYRLDGGVIFGSGQQFDRVCYNVPLDTLFEEGYITRPKTLKVSEVDLTGVKRTAGDFNKAEVESKFLGNSITKEFLAAANDKGAQSVLVFASGVAHAQVIEGELKAMGESVHVVTGDTPELFRETAIDMFKARKTRFLVNVECFTTGFDVPCVDMIVLARATESPGLLLQMVGRGFRLFKGKDLCWVLDYGGNFERHGPVDSATYGIDTIKPAATGEGEAPKRICPQCFTENPAGAKRCFGCGLEFPKKPKVLVASDESVLVKPEWLEVEETIYQRWKGKDGKKDTLRATYVIKQDENTIIKRRVSEWICVEHEGWAGKRAADWWMSVSRNTFPASIDECLEIINVIGIADIKRIKVKLDGKYHRVLYREADEAPEPRPLEYGDLYSEEDIPF